MPRNSYPKKEITNGAAGVIHLAISDDWAGITGQYFSAGKIGKPSAIAQDKKQAKELWNVTQRIINDLTSTS